MTYCKYDGVDYSEGSIKCMEGKEYECVEERWKYTGRDCAENDNQQIISPAGSVTVGANARCMTVILTAGGFNLYNTCSECKVAVLFMTDNQLVQTRKEVRVESKKAEFVDMRGIYKCDYVDDLPCTV